MVILELVSLVFAGVLAGEEFVVRYGVQPSLNRLEDVAHLRARQSLIRRLRILVPSIMLPTVLLAIAVLVFAGSNPGLAFRWAAIVAYVALLVLSFAGTVPINIAIGAWDSAAPPPDWKQVVHRWEFLDIFRSSAAILGFVFLLVALALQLPG
jgi:uncharacterized membrane protein